MGDKVETEINGRKYKLELCGARQATRIELRLVKLLGSALGPLIASGKAGIARGMVSLQNGNEADLDYLIDAFAEKTEIVLAEVQLSRGGKLPVQTMLRDQFDNHFSGGRRVEQWIWFAWCIQENFADFFVEARRDNALAIVKKFAPDLFASESQRD